MGIPAQARALFEEAHACHVFERFLGADLSVATPGHPVNGLDPFVQPSGGPFMLRLFLHDRSAYLWKNESGQWFLRPWMDQATHDDGLVIEVVSLEQGLKQLEQNINLEAISNSADAV